MGWLVTGAKGMLGIDLCRVLERRGIPVTAVDRGDLDLLDPVDFVAAMDAAAGALHAWHRDGRRGPRPPGRLRPHRPEQLSWLTRLWATPLYRLVNDPDGRPVRLRLAKRF